VLAVAAVALALAAPAPFQARLVAPSHAPEAGDPWAYAVLVTDAAGKPLRARIDVRIVLGPLTVGQLQKRAIDGVFVEPLQWPADAVGQALTVEAAVTVGGRTRRVQWPVTVRARSGAKQTAGAFAGRGFAVRWKTRPTGFRARGSTRWSVTCNRGASATVVTSGTGDGPLWLPAYTRQECAAAVLASPGAAVTLE
jgi:hypothetical protein